MRKKLIYSVLFLLGTSAVTVHAQEKKALSWKDVASWNFVRPNANALSPNGNWAYWISGPNEGDLSLTLQSTLDTSKYIFPLGGSGGNVSFSENNRYLAFREAPKFKEAKAAQQAKRPAFSKLIIVQLSDTAKTQFEKVRSYSFAGVDSDWIGITFASETAAPRGPSAPKGSDLLLYNLNTKKSFNLGNVGEFQFNKNGNILAFTIDAEGQNGNAVLIRDMNTGVTTILDNGKANYSAIRWNEDGNAFTLLKSETKEDYKTLVYAVVGISHINGEKTKKVIYNGLEDSHFPVGKGISKNGQVAWSDDLNQIYFGIDLLEKKEKPTAKGIDAKDGAQDSTAAKTDDKGATVTRIAATPGASGPGQARPGQGGPAAAANPSATNDERPDMIIWNWQDKRLQSAQQISQERDRNFNLFSGYDIKAAKFIPLADSSMRTVQAGPKQKYALGYDYTPYEMDNNLSGQNYVDVYLIDLKTNEKICLLENYYLNASRTLAFSPDGLQLVYYRDGHYHHVHLPTKQHTNLTSDLNTSFVDDENDHNVVKPATPLIGWSADSKYVLVQDGNEIWKISNDGKKAISLNPGSKAQNLQAGAPVRIYKDDKGIDLKKNQYFQFYNTRNKEMGLGILDAGKDVIRILFLGENRYRALQKADQANVFAYFKESSTESPELLVTRDLNLGSTRQLTKNTPNQEKYALSEGVRLIEFVSDYGDTLQASLYLPAGYVEGQSYPTITYIYERLTQDLHSYAQPSLPGGGFNRAMYTSNGYAVLMPDIKYKMNEPGNSAVACVIPAVKAAIATGIVDSENVAIHGHSWGGYQTSFLITQTDLFKAAAAGAPLTNMISMYSLIYWNSGSANQSIFESSQGRFTSGYWDNWDAYKRNSPIYYIKNVQTPLLLLHNDKDGAVDYTQGIEYYNGLRRLNKPVVMITYKGENHGIVKDVNKKDYAVRMMEYFDHHLKSTPAPDWWAKGVDLIDLKDHLTERAF